jgi:hypothetical protein
MRQKYEKKQYLNKNEYLFPENSYFLFFMLSLSPRNNTKQKKFLITNKRVILPHKY